MLVRCLTILSLRQKSFGSVRLQSRVQDLRGGLSRHSFCWTRCAKNRWQMLCYRSIYVFILAANNNHKINVSHDSKSGETLEFYDRGIDHAHAC